MIAYVAFMHAVVLLSQREAWPFANYQVLHGQASLAVRIWRLDFLGIDGNGRSWRIDPYAFEPLHKLPLQAWVRGFLPKMPKENKQRAMAFLLQKAEEARQRAAAGKNIGYERYIGPIAAPYWYLLPREPQVSSLPYRQLKIDLVEWTTEEALAVPPREHRYVLTVYPR